MAELLWPMTSWHWLAIGLVLIAGEALIPGFILMWFGIGAIVTGIALWLSPEMYWHWQLIVFAVISVASLLLWRIRLQKHPTPTEQPGLNERAGGYIGREFITAEGIRNGTGRIAIGDTSWRVEGPNCAAGSTVRVVGVNGASLVVEEI